MTRRAEIKIEGQVQGVGFRYFVSAWAKDLGLSGFVKNTIDGGVKIVCEGDEGKIKELIAVLKKGPPGAQVDNIDVSWEKAKNSFSDFEIKF